MAITIDENLNLGRTEKCDTFNNPPMVEGNDFVCGTIEVFCFENKWVFHFNVHVSFIQLIFLQELQDQFYCYQAL